MNEVLMCLVALAAGFGLGWTLRAALARADRVFPEEFDRFPPTMIIEPEEIIDLEWDCMPTQKAMMREYFKDRGGRS